MSEIDILKGQIESLHAALVAKEETHKIEICKLIEIDLNDTVSVELTEWGATYLNAMNTFKEMTTPQECTGSLFIPYEATNILVLLMFCERDILTGLMVQPVRSN